MSVLQRCGKFELSSTYQDPRMPVSVSSIAVPWAPGGQGRANTWDIRAYCKPLFCFLGKPCEGSSLDSLISKDDGEAPLSHS